MIVRIPPAHDRMAVSLTLQQDEDAGGDGEDRHDHGQAGEVELQQPDQPGQDEPNAQQQKAYVPGQFHFGILSSVATWRASGPATP